MKHSTLLALIPFLSLGLLSCGGSSSEPVASSPFSEERGASSVSLPEEISTEEVPSIVISSPDDSLPTVESNSEPEGSKASKGGSSIEEESSSKGIVEESSNVESSSEEESEITYYASCDEYRVAMVLNEEAALQEGQDKEYMALGFKAVKDAVLAISDGTASLSFDIDEGSNLYEEDNEAHFKEGGEVDLYLKHYEDDHWSLFASSPAENYGIFIDGSYYDLPVCSNITPEEGKDGEWAIKEIDVTKETAISFSKNDQALDNVFLDPINTNNLKLRDSVFYPRFAGKMDIYLKHYEDGRYLVWASGYQSYSEEVLAATFKVKIGNREAVALSLNSEAYLRPTQIAEFAVTGLDCDAGDVLSFTMDGDDIFVPAEASFNNNYRLNDNGEVCVYTKCIGCADVYLKAYEDRFEVWLSGYLEPSEPDMRKNYLIEPTNDADVYSPNMKYFALLKYGDDSSTWVVASRDGYYNAYEFKTEVEPASFYLIACQYETSLSAILSNGASNYTIYQTNERATIYNIFNYNSDIAWILS